MKKNVYNRGKGTVELPFLLSCALFLLDRRYWILGLRSALAGTRFDLVSRYGGEEGHVVVVEAKYRGDGRPVRPYEVQRFVEEVRDARGRMPGANIYGVFMTNTRFSPKALDLARRFHVRTYPNVPLLFRLLTGGESEEGGEGK